MDKIWVAIADIKTKSKETIIEFEQFDNNVYASEKYNATS